MVSISNISLDPCKIPNENIKIKPKKISDSSGRMEVIHKPKKLRNIDKL
jgi:hypothetical protein